MITVDLPLSLPPVLAVGAYLKNTVCRIDGTTATLSDVHGDLGTPEARLACEASVAALTTDFTPARVAHDLHPDFFSTHLAQRLGLPTLAVQHHHAHTAAIAAEHSVTGPVLGLSLDGFGLGPGQQSWGGELLLCDGAAYQRLGHLALLAQPGGDTAAREPWRMAAAVLHRLGRGEDIARRWPDHPAAKLLPQMLDRGLNSPLTSSAGRLFDAACGLLNVLPVAEFEGQAPMALEALADAPTVQPDGWTIDDNGVLDLLPLLRILADETDPRRGANLFHGTLAAALADWCQRLAPPPLPLALGGGCFLNKVLCGSLIPALHQRGYRVLTAQRLSCGDAGLSLGQAWIAAHAVSHGDG